MAEPPLHVNGGLEGGKEKEIKKKSIGRRKQRDGRGKAVKEREKVESVAILEESGIGGGAVRMVGQGGLWHTT